MNGIYNNPYVLELIMDALKDEKNAARLYERLAEAAQGDEEKELLMQLVSDERKHYKMLLEIYYTLTGERLENEPEADEPTISDNLCREYARLVKEEIEAAKGYRTMFFLFLNQELRDNFFEILTDEQHHALILSYLTGACV